MEQQTLISICQLTIWLTLSCDPVLYGLLHLKNSSNYLKFLKFQGWEILFNEFNDKKQLNFNTQKLLSMEEVLMTAH